MGRFGYLAGLVLLLLFLGFKGVLAQPPAADRLVTDFDVDRAQARLERIIADTSHPPGSEANDAVRARLVAELEAAGLSPTVNAYDHCTLPPTTRRASCLQLHNILVTVGEGDGPHLLVNSHYDSTIVGQGGSDDGVGVAAMIEVASLLAEGPAPARPVTFLFNEGEEKGLVGAHAFNTRNPLADRVDTLINIESRGTDGPALMYRPSEGDGGILEAFAAASPHPRASSVSSAFATLIPNVTDGREFDRTRDWHKLEYAIAFNEARYHSTGDIPAALNRDTLAHVGDEVLAATRHLAAGAPDDAGPRVYTDIAGLVFLTLPQWLALAMMVVAVIGLGVAGIRQGGAWRPFGRVAAAFLLAFGLGVLMASVLPMLRDGQYWRGTPIYFLLAIYAAALAGLLLVIQRTEGETARARLPLAAWLFVAGVGLVLAFLLPGTLIFFAITCLAAAIAFFLPTPGRTVLLWIAVLFQLLLVAQLLAQIEEIMIAGLHWAGVPLLLLAALPFFAMIARGGTGRLAAASAAPAAALASVGLALVALSVDAASPRSPAFWPALFHYQDGDDDPIFIVPTSVAFPDQWREAQVWERKDIDALGSDYWVAAAPALSMGRPGLDLDVRRDGDRTLLDFSFDGAAEEYAVRLAGDADVVAMGRIGDLQRVEDAEDGDNILRCSGPQCPAMRFGILIEGEVPASLSLITSQRGLVDPEARRLAAMMPDDHVVKWSPHLRMRHAAVAIPQMERAPGSTPDAPSE